MVDESGAGAADLVSGRANGPPETLEQRVQRLEDAVAALQDTQIMEERILERLLGKTNFQAEVRSLHVKSAEQRTVPAPAPADTPAAEPPADTPAVPPAPARRPWLIAEVFREIRTMIGMFFDYRFRTSWSALFALMLLAYILVSRWLWSLWAGVPILGVVSVPMNFAFLGDILDKVLDLILALFAYKILSREVVRYKETIANYSPHYGHY